MTVRFLDIISFITAFQLSLLAIVIISYQKGIRLSNRILSVFLMSNACLIGNYLVFRLGILSSSKVPFLYFAGHSTYLLLAPLLFIYTNILCYRDFRFKKIYLLHFIPYLLLTIFLTIRFYLRLTGAQGNFEGQISLTTVHDRLLYYGTLHLQIATYMILSFQTLHHYRAALKKLYSSIEQINLSWLLLLIISFVLMWVMDVISCILDFLSGDFERIQSILVFFSLTINFVFATAIVFKGLKYPQIFSGIEETPKYAKSKLTREEGERYLKQVKTYMETQKPYLIASLSLNDLANKLSLSARYLSQVINDSLNQNFFDFINSYRIEEAKRLFSHPAQRRKTVLEILFEVGFNSKSVFNNAFKKHTGFTPTEFKKLHAN